MKISYQLGSTAVEFALVLVFFLMFVLGLVDISRLAYTWNAASEAALWGARYAIVCADTTDATEAEVLSKMQSLVPAISSIDLEWVGEDEGTSCTPTECEGVTVRIQGMNFQWVTPIVGQLAPTFTMPNFATYLPREAMRQDPNSGAFCS